MPFAGYTDFEDCRRKNADKGDPDAYCGSIKHKVEDKMIRKHDRANTHRHQPSGKVTMPFDFHGVSGVPHSHGSGEGNYPPKKHTHDRGEHYAGKMPRYSVDSMNRPIKNAFNPSEATRMHGRPGRSHSHTQIGATKPTTHTHGRGYHSYGGGLDTATQRRGTGRPGTYREREIPATMSKADEHWYANPKIEKDPNWPIHRGKDLGRVIRNMRKQIMKGDPALVGYPPGPLSGGNGSGPKHGHSSNDRSLPEGSRGVVFSHEHSGGETPHHHQATTQPTYHSPYTTGGPKDSAPMSSYGQGAYKMKKGLKGPILEEGKKKDGKYTEEAPYAQAFNADNLTKRALRLSYGPVFEGIRSVIKKAGENVPGNLNEHLKRAHAAIHGREMFNPKYKEMCQQIAAARKVLTALEGELEEAEQQKAGMDGMGVPENKAWAPGERNAYERRTREIDHDRTFGKPKAPAGQTPMSVYETKPGSHPSDTRGIHSHGSFKHSDTSPSHGPIWGPHSHPFNRMPSQSSLGQFRRPGSWVVSTTQPKPKKDKAVSSYPAPKKQGEPFDTHMRRISRQNANMPDAMRGVMGSGDLHEHKGQGSHSHPDAWTKHTHQNRYS